MKLDMRYGHHPEDVKHYDTDTLRRHFLVEKIFVTGELTLTGHVLPIGGVREKVIAARRQKINELILPESNRGNFEELPDYLKDGITAHFASHYRDVAKVLFQ